MENPASNIEVNFKAPFSKSTMQHLAGKKRQKNKGNLPYLKARRSLRVNALKHGV
jgi:hypothetical protein